MEPEGLLPHSQEPATCPYPEPDQYSPCFPSSFSKIHFNIIILSRIKLEVRMFVLLIMRRYIPGDGLVTRLRSLRCRCFVGTCCFHFMVGVEDRMGQQVSPNYSLQLRGTKTTKLSFRKTPFDRWCHHYEYWYIHREVCFNMYLIKCKYFY